MISILFIGSLITTSEIDRVGGFWVKKTTWITPSGRQYYKATMVTDSHIRRFLHSFGLEDDRIHNLLCEGGNVFIFPPSKEVNK